MDGLMTGLLKFDAHRGNRLSRLVVWWIRRSVSVLATDFAQVVYIPRDVSYGAWRLKKSQALLSSRLGR